jgi:hypothetical protein
MSIVNIITINWINRVRAATVCLRAALRRGANDNRRHSMEETLDTGPTTGFFATALETLTRIFADYAAFNT